MDFNVTREQWVDRFVLRISALEAGAEPAHFAALADSLWPSQGQIAPESAADAAAADRRRSADGAVAAFENTQRFTGESPFERTQRVPVERIQAEGEYVRDNDEWVARCVARVLSLDPIIKADEAQRSVADLAALERWRLMRPEAAAEQLYTPIKPRQG
ncbi:MAG: hypothetical protein ABIO71_06210 [Caldimonas sp.]